MTMMIKSLALGAGFAALAAAAPVNAQLPSGKRVAFLVGVREYDHSKLSELKFTEADVTATATLLSDAGYRTRGPEFVEEGIEHVAMDKRLR